MVRPRRPLIALFVLLLISSVARAAPPDTYCNPVDVLIADPFIYHEKDTYYLYGTAAHDGLLVWTSRDLVDWQLHDHAFRRTRDTWSQRYFWAPEMFKHKDKYYLHFTALGSGRKRRIVLAESDSPLGPFKETKAPWFDPGDATIDSHVFRDTDGQLYLYTVALDHPPEKKLFEIYVRKLDENLNPSKEATFCITPNEAWEGIVNEGPFVQKRNGLYYLTFSTVGYMSPEYGVSVATSKSPLGPWKKVPGNHVLQRTADVSGPGHHCFIDSPDGKEMFIAYHTHQHLDHPGPPRQLAIDRAHFVDGPEPTIVIDGPTITPQMMPSGAAALVRGQDDEFDDSTLDRKRWTIFSEDPSHWSLKDGKLNIKTFDGDVYEDRADASNIFLQYAPLGDFDVTTKVSIHPEKDYELAFIGLWQNHNQYVKLAVVHSHGGIKLEVGNESSGRYASRLHDAPTLDNYWLRISKTSDRYEFSFSLDGKEWKKLDSEYATLLNIKAAIGACSPESNREIPVAFDFVRFTASAQK
jgi:beta-xylosidase